MPHNRTDQLMLLGAELSRVVRQLGFCHYLGHQMIHAPMVGVSSESTVKAVKADLELITIQLDRVRDQFAEFQSIEAMENEVRHD